MMVGVAGPLNRLLYLLDKKTNRKFLIDTGASVSAFPASKVHQNFGRSASSSPLIAANGSKIKTFGTIGLTINLGS